jgi:hypothetical protein
VMEEERERSHPLVMNFQGSAISPLERPRNTTLALNDAYAARTAAQ